MNYNYPILSFVSTALRYVGLFIAGLGILIAVIGLFTLLSGNGPVGAVMLIIGALLVPIGLVSTVIGEVVGVLFSIEDNTSRSEDFLKKLYESSSRWQTPAPQPHEHKVSFAQTSTYSSIKEESYYYQNADGSQVGPFALSLLKLRREAGKLDEGTLVRKVGGDAKWKPYDQISS